MSLPRAVVPGRTYMITRRCSERRSSSGQHRWVTTRSSRNQGIHYCQFEESRRAAPDVRLGYGAPQGYPFGEGRLLPGALPDRNVDD